MRLMTRAGARTTMLLLAVVVAATVVVFVAPDERTLGRGIRSVYVHVALTLAGMLGLGIAAGLGIVTLLLRRRRFHGWMLSIGRVGLLLYAAGVAVSLVAARVNWGAVSLGEPILRTSLLVLGVGVIAHLLVPFSTRIRVHAALSVVPVVALGWLAAGTAFVMHPQGPVVQRSSATILLTFAVLVLLFSLAGGRLSWHLRRWNDR